jgi:hypothetical protein
MHHNPAQEEEAGASTTHTRQRRRQRDEAARCWGWRRCATAWYDVTCVVSVCVFVCIGCSVCIQRLLTPPPPPIAYDDPNYDSDDAELQPRQAAAGLDSDEDVTSSSSTASDASESDDNDDAHARGGSGGSTIASTSMSPQQTDALGAEASTLLARWCVCVHVSSVRTLLASHTASPPSRAARSATRQWRRARRQPRRRRCV